MPRHKQRSWTPRACGRLVAGEPQSGAWVWSAPRDKTPGPLLLARQERLRSLDCNGDLDRLLMHATNWAETRCGPYAENRGAKRCAHPFFEATACLMLFARFLLTAHACYLTGFSVRVCLCGQQAYVQAFGMPCIGSTFTELPSKNHNSHTFAAFASQQHAAALCGTIRCARWRPARR